ncbi:hypothetical protein [Rossellomorea vietnamensis]|uniref:hypothetical protein n=1 Tax=Rossellomorea vietnamensis TaxID=218284 RepID=UPI00077CB5C9|nr:hypothetical protein [Rossellomorea vietnamensis]
MEGYCIKCDELKEIEFDDEGDLYCEDCFDDSVGYQSDSADLYGICDYCGKNRKFGNCSC